MAILRRLYFASQSLVGVDNYKRIVYNQPGLEEPLYYDRIMLQILQEISDIWGSADISKVNLIGFSGGGQFAHRFFYLHPDRLKSVSIGAPGNATYLDPNQPWPLGTKDLAQLFDRATVVIERLRGVPIQLFIGSADTYHTVNYDGSRAELSRYGVLEKLHRNYTEIGLPHTFDVEPGIAHQGDLLLHLVQPMVLKYLR